MKTESNSYRSEKETNDRSRDLDSTHSNEFCKCSDSTEHELNFEENVVGKIWCQMPKSRVGSIPCCWDPRTLQYILFCFFCIYAYGDGTTRPKF
jgi:hypothetical protein